MRKINVVAAVLKNDKDEVLCALRSPTMSSPNVWEFPGGKIEEGELPKEALIREIEEELDCSIEVFDLIKEVDHRQRPDFNIRLLTYKAKVINGTPQAKEHAKLEWKPLAELRSLKWAPADIPTVERLLTGV
ncbi:DNA mismatch repair protein MutT [Anaerobacillus arseniciselenatis]|uniref:8-oxo-dGTP diphosphatase n=1 Tax=Anaerobacillus arseniciselenatis TaxID=85682 RepID=A0A1S2LV59_9BACI|nr:(deoxy)nucleoside triphosphate pyrophosphohydrolase [Anaerobacillus arseniciselenatis]OIJ15537.1 DNA mismatch repair protein MutT [Anaerobacillus arseniciselenatis]